MGFFPTGVTIVTSWQDGAPVASTINAFCSVSLEPPLLLICLAHSNPVTRPLAQCGVFGVNILGADGAALAMHFGALPETDRFAEVGYRVTADGAPQLDAAPMFVDCRLENTVTAGDHVIVVGRGIRVVRAAETPPLLYQRGRFPRLELNV